jgi:hypothetical protein
LMAPTSAEWQGRNTIIGIIEFFLRVRNPVAPVRVYTGN